jgi:ABC-2 type transport system ATP-binding protein
MLEILNLRKEYNGIVAVNNLSFKVQQGKIFGLLGPNGAGKTTTIRIILDIIKPTYGEILFFGKNIDSNFQSLTGYLPEERGLYKKSKVIDVIKYFSLLKNISKNQVNILAEEWLEKFDIINYRNKKIEELSKGNQQKVQFITTVIHNPKVLILDEPFTGFDPINQQLIKDLILSFAHNGKIIILSTHLMDVAEEMCSEIILINKGKEIIQGNINDIKNNFGLKNIKVDFVGDKSIFETINSIKCFNIFQNHADIELNHNSSPSDLLKSLVNKIEVKNFSIIEPTLHQIFIQLIKDNKG